MPVPCPNPKCVISSDYIQKVPIIFFFLPFMAPWVWLDSIFHGNDEKENKKNIVTIITKSDGDDYGIHDSVELNICDRCGYRLGDPQPWQKNNRIKRFIFCLLLMFFSSVMTLYTLSKGGEFFWTSLILIVFSSWMFKETNDHGNMFSEPPLYDILPREKNERIIRFIFFIPLILFYLGMTLYSLLVDNDYFWLSLFFLFISLIYFRSTELYKLSDDDE